MHSLQDFVNNFWSCALPAVFITLLRIASLVSPIHNASSVTTRRFPELKPFGKWERKELLHEADRKAFRGWLSIMPALAEGFILFVAMAIVASKGMSWRGMVVGVAIGVSCVWIINTIAARRIEPFLRSEIAAKLKQQEAANA